MSDKLYMLMSDIYFMSQSVYHGICLIYSMAYIHYCLDVKRTPQTQYVCGRQSSDLKNTCVLILSICEYVTIHGKRDFADVNKQRTLIGRLLWII